MQEYKQEELDLFKRMMEEQEVQVVESEPVKVVEKVVRDKPLTITSLQDLQTFSQGSIVEFPDFAEGQPFVARVKRPSMLMLAKSGKIPNTLLFTANELFTKDNGNLKSLDTDNEKALEDMYNVMETVCEASLLEPTLQDIKDAGLELSDDQLTAIFSYTQGGVKALETFRQQ